MTNRIEPLSTLTHPFFDKVDFRDINHKDVRAPYRPSMLEYKKDQAKRQQDKIVMPEFTGDSSVFDKAGF